MQCCLFFHLLYFLLFAHFSLHLYISSSVVIPLIFIARVWKSLPIFLLFLAQLFLLCTYCEFVLPFLPIILLSSFIQFPGKRQFQLSISDCSQPASAQLWGGDSWRKLRVAFPFTLAATREVVSHPPAHRQCALLSLWLLETERLKLRLIRRANHGVCLQLSLGWDGCPWAHGGGKLLNRLMRAKGTEDHHAPESWSVAGFQLWASVSIIGKQGLIWHLLI